MVRKSSSNSASRPRRGNLAQAAADRLREAVLRGTYPSGSPMPEVELSKELGISRIPLREAFRRLVGEGLLELRPNRGVVVASLSESELLQIAEVCRLLEGHLLRQAFPQLTPAILRRAGERLGELEGIDDVVEWSRVNWAFHVELYAAAERPLVLDLVSGLRAKAERYMLLLVAEKERRRMLNREHRAILAACRARRARLCAERLDAHLAGGHDKVLRLLEPR